MSTSSIYAGNNIPLITTAQGTIIPFDNIVRRFGKNLNISGGNVTVTGDGYYKGFVNITYTGSAAGTVVFTVLKDGVAIPFATASATTAENVINNIAIPFEIREKCCCESTITVIASGAVVTINNDAILVDKE